MSKRSKILKELEAAMDEFVRVFTKAKTLSKEDEKWVRDKAEPSFDKMEKKIEELDNDD